MRIDIIDFFFTGVMLAAMTSSVCHAGVNDVIADCGKSASQNARILCLESALRAMANADNVPAPAKAVETPLPAEPAGQVTAAPVVAAVPPQAGIEAVAEAKSSSDTESGSARHEADDSASDELGLEQVEARNESNRDEQSIFRATVVDYDFVGYRRLLVQLDNGQIWRQIDGDRTSVERGIRDEKTFDVELWATGLGGYRMRIAPVNRTIRVERLK